MNGMEEGQVRLHGQYCIATEGSWLMILGHHRRLGGWPRAEGELCERWLASVSERDY